MMNWGYKIVFVYAIFVAGIVLMVVKSSSQNVDLVRPDYYEEELRYQETIDATQRANALSTKLQLKVVNDTLQVGFPDEMKVSGVYAKVWLYCIADVKKDVNKSFSVENGWLRLPLPAVNKGLHDVKVSWTLNGLNYYFEQKLFIQ
jgi:hypothetical protein